MGVGGGGGRKEFAERIVEVSRLEVKSNFRAKYIIFQTLFHSQDAKSFTIMPGQT